MTFEQMAADLEILQYLNQEGLVVGLVAVIVAMVYASRYLTGSQGS